MASLQTEASHNYSCRVKGEVILFDVDIPDSAVARYEAFQHRRVATTWIVTVQLSRPIDAIAWLKFPAINN